MRFVVSEQYLLHRVWRQMRQRCTNSNDPRFSAYGARGIKVCKRWDSFVLFLEDVGERPLGKTSAGRAAYQIERIDNDKGYEPSNVKWAHYIGQANNRRTNHLIEYNGERCTLSQWSKRLGIRPGTLLKRLKMGWSLECALSSEVRSY